MADSYGYDSFGNPLLASGTTLNAFQYVGQAGYYVDPDVVQYYLRARYYDPVTGRYPQPGCRSPNVATLTTYRLIAVMTRHR